jgi:hypothetical protein
MNDFDPMDADRPPRSEGWKNETEQIFNLIRSRGDQRIGQLLLNAVRSEHGDGSVEEAANALWKLEAPELLELLVDATNTGGDRSE